MAMFFPTPKLLRTLAMMLAIAAAPAVVRAQEPDGDMTGAISRARTVEPVESPSPMLHMLPAVATDVRLTGDDKRTRLVLDLTRPVEPNAFLLADPRRVIVDLDEVNFRLPKLAGQQGRGVVAAFRFGLFAPGKSRIVIDLAANAVIDKAFALEAAEGEPARIIIDLLGSDEAAMTRAIVAQASSNLAARGDREAARGRRMRAAEAAGLPVIVLDPGHGGADSGALAAGGGQEKTIVLDFATHLRDRLVQTGRYAVMMTRDKDYFLTLDARVRIAREAKAALFISIHADSLASNDTTTRGATIYTLSDTASDEEAAKMAERENKADAIAGVNLAEEPNDIADILIDLAQRETRAFSTTFARSLAGQMKQATTMHRLPLRSAGFRVLRAQDVPSILLELGYMTNQQDVRQLQSAEWRMRTVDSMVKAIDAFFQLRDKHAGK